MFPADIVGKGTSIFLKNASISLTGPSTINIDCEFLAGYPQASCVLVYRQYDSSLLTVVELPQLVNFPVSTTVESPENYTFALFGKNNDIGMEQEPLIYVKFDKDATNQTSNGQFIGDSFSVMLFVHGRYESGYRK